MAFGDGAFGGQLGHVDGALINGISTLVKKRQERDDLSRFLSLRLPYEDTARSQEEGSH